MTWWKNTSAYLNPLTSTIWKPPAISWKVSIGSTMRVKISKQFFTARSNTWIKREKLYQKILKILKMIMLYYCIIIWPIFQPLQAVLLTYQRMKCKIFLSNWSPSNLKEMALYKELKDLIKNMVKILQISNFLI